jgi:hypothetical protein
MFEHRKYHWLWFLLGMMIAIILGTLMGCERGTTEKGRPCVGFVGMTVEGEQCEVIEWPPQPPEMCCQALTPACMAMCEGIPEDVWIKNTCGINAIDAEYYGWNEELNEPIWLCQAVGIPEWAE